MNKNNILKKLYQIAILYFLAILIQINNANTTGLYSFISEISLKIKDSGIQKILNSDSLLPSEIYINGNKLDKIKKRYYFENEINIILMKWNYSLTDCSNMFYEINNIEEINLSNFDSSTVTSMSSMFQGCSSLVSLDFSNLNTSSLIYMDYIFADCYSLKRLNLSGISTSKVRSMAYMFYNCYSLKSLFIEF